MSEDLQRYVVFVVEDEPAWEAKTADEREDTYQHDHRFGQALERRGGRVVGGAGLAPSRTWKVLRHDGGRVALTDGPYAESVEQLGGFFVVESPSLEAVVEAAREMLPAHVRLEIAPASEED